MRTELQSPSLELQSLVADRLHLQFFDLHISRRFALAKRSDRNEFQTRVREYQKIISTTEMGLSAAHCEVLGGFVTYSKKTPVGFSLDEVDKDHFYRLEKVCRDYDEWQTAPSASSFRVAKSAALQAIQKVYPDLNCERRFKIGGWTVSSAGIFESFQIRECTRPFLINQGCVVNLGDIKMGFLTFGAHCQFKSNS